MEKNNKTLNVPPLRFPEFSGEWEKCTISDFGNVITGNTPPTAEDENYDKGTHLWASPADLGTTKYIESTQTLLSDRGFEKSRSFPANSILVTCIGSTIGKMGMSKTEMASNQQINTIVPVQHDANFVYYAVQSRFPRYLSSIAVQAVPILSKSSFEKLTNYTTARKEQIKIGNLLSLIDERIDTQKKIIEKHESLIRGLYHSVFNQPAVALQLNDVVSVVKGKQVNGEDLLEDGKYYMMNGGTEPSGYLDEYNTPANTISISEGGNSCGYVQYNTEPFWSGGHCYSLIQKEVNINYQYLYHFLKYKERDIMALRIGSGLPNVQKKDLERFEIRLLPIEQQNRVADILEGLSAKCGLEKRVLQRWQSQKSFLLRNLFI